MDENNAVDEGFRINTPPSPQNGEQKSGKKRIVIVVTVLLAALITTGVLAFSPLPGAIFKMVAPERYLQAALVKTAAVLNGRQKVSMPDFGKFDGEQTEVEFTAGINRLSEAIFEDAAEALGGSSVTFKAQADRATKELLMDFDVYSSLMNLENNKIYVATDIIAFFLPDLYPGYLTIDTKTFTEDFNGSPLAEEYTLEDDFDLSEVISQMFDDAPAGADSGSGIDTSLYTEEMNRLSSIVRDNVQFTNGGSASVSVNGKTIKTSKMSYTLPKDSLNAVYADVISLYKDIVYELAASNNYEAYYGEFMDVLDELFNTLEESGYDDNLVINFYIDNKGLVSRLDINDIPFSVYDQYSGTSSQTVYGIEAELFGNELRDMRATFKMESDYGNVSLVFNTSTKSDKNVLDESMTLDVLLNNISMAVFSYGAHYSGGDFLLDLSLKGNFSDMTAKITAALSETDDSVSLSDGRLSVEYGGDSMADIGFSFEAREAGGIIRPDTTGGTDIFDLLSLMGAFN